MIGVLGEDYTTRLRELFKGRVPGGADFVTYWFEKAWSLVEQSKAQRAGLVATNSIRGGASRRVLDQICEGGTIFDAWSDEPWVIDGAAVRVSIICFRRGKRTHDMAASEPKLKLNSKDYDFIHADLTGGYSVVRDFPMGMEIVASVSSTPVPITHVGFDLTKAKPLPGNAGTAFQGTIKVGAFDIPGDLAREWLQAPLNPNGRPNSDVLRLWANGMDITRRPSDTWIIDFGVTLPESEAALYELPFQYAVNHIKNERSGKREERASVKWWLMQRARPEMRKALEPLSRYIITPRVSKHRLFVWMDKRVMPDSATVAIARDDNTLFGILHSRFHELWTLRLCTWLGVGNDPRYTPSTTFETFPFPEGLTPDIPAGRYAADPRSIAIAEAAKRLNERRDKWLNPPDLVKRVPEVVPGYPDRILPIDAAAAATLKTRTLTNLYNQRPAWLTKAHADLDAAVAAAYGWPADISDDELLKRLLEMNCLKQHLG